ncbi:hypothetical protein J5N97_003664 [Dioscorea zingiberensis]|uniref:Uncharacterized protein n=1 Tax=Dioscorea zingiberensis TaxID=325984 RepID=A0A9D5HQR1_9LILI|nr:hypothetical protein J5N97_003664 [Dioscorea zingiberensis]
MAMGGSRSCHIMTIIERIKALASTNGEHIIYLGDGKGDYCPSLKLTKGDHVMARKVYPLWELASENAKLIKADIHEWSNGEELERILTQLSPTLMSPTAPSFIPWIASLKQCQWLLLNSFPRLFQFLTDHSQFLEILIQIED